MNGRAEGESLSALFLVDCAKHSAKITSMDEQIKALEAWMLVNQHPPVVFQTVLKYLREGRTEDASWVLQNDSDKFYDRKATILFLHSIGLVGESWRESLNKFSFRDNPLK